MQSICLSMRSVWKAVPRLAFDVIHNQYWVYFSINILAICINNRHQCTARLPWSSPDLFQPKIIPPLQYVQKFSLVSLYRSDKNPNLSFERTVSRAHLHESADSAARRWSSVSGDAGIEHQSLFVASANLTEIWSCWSDLHMCSFPHSIYIKFRRSIFSSLHIDTDRPHLYKFSFNYVRLVPRPSAGHPPCVDFRPDSRFHYCSGGEIIPHCQHQHFIARNINRDIQHSCIWY